MIKLTAEEATEAALVGAKRRIIAKERQYDDDKYGKRQFDADAWENDCEGAIAEYYIAKMTHQYWNMFDPKKPDVGMDIEVRWTADHNNRLIVRPGATEWAKYVLVTGRYPDQRYRGWIYGHLAMNPDYLQTINNRPPAYFVPIEALTNESL